MMPLKAVIYAADGVIKVLVGSTYIPGKGGGGGASPNIR